VLPEKLQPCNGTLGYRKQRQCIIPLQPRQHLELREHVQYTCNNTVRLMPQRDVNVILVQPIHRKKERFYIYQVSHDESSKKRALDCPTIQSHRHGLLSLATPSDLTHPVSNNTFSCLTGAAETGARCSSLAKGPPLIGASTHKLPNYIPLLKVCLFSAKFRDVRNRNVICRGLDSDDELWQRTAFYVKSKY
jgi:hypothetical protein